MSLLDRAEAFLHKARQLNFEVNGRDAPTRGFRTWDRKRLQYEMMKRDPLWGAVDNLRPHLRARAVGKWVGDDNADDPEELAPIGYRVPGAAPPIPLVAPWSAPRRDPWPRW